MTQSCVHAAALLLVSIDRHGLAHMDIAPDNILLDKEFVSQEEVSSSALLGGQCLTKSLNDNQL